MMSFMSQVCSKMQSRSSKFCKNMRSNVGRLCKICGYFVSKLSDVHKCVKVFLQVGMTRTMVTLFQV